MRTIYILLILIFISNAKSELIIDNKSQTLPRDTLKPIIKWEISCDGELLLEAIDPENDYKYYETTGLTYPDIISNNFDTKTDEIEFFQKIYTVPPSLYSQHYDFGKVRISYPFQPTNQYEAIGSEIITAINGANGEFGSELIISNIVFTGVEGPVGSNKGFTAFSFDSNFINVLPSNPNNFFSGIRVAPESKSNQSKIYFRPMMVGKYEIEYYFESNAEASGEETRYVIKGHGIMPNLYLYQDDNAIEIINVVDFGSKEASNLTEAVRKTLTITNQPKDIENGDVLTITSIDWGSDVTTDHSELGESKNFYVNETKMLADIGGSGAYPISLGIGESVDVDVTYFTKQYDAEHRSIVLIESDADESGQSGKFNNTITLLGNAKSSSVINKNTVSNFYPSPANNLITFDKSIKGNIEVYNLLGEKVLEFNAKLKSTFDISQLQNGIYIIKYKFNGQYFSEKLSVSR